MALIPFYVPLIITVLSLVYIVLAGKFIPGFRDEGIALILTVGSWIAYALGKFLTTALGSDTMALFFIVGVIVIIVIYKIKKG